MKTPAICILAGTVSMLVVGCCPLNQFSDSCRSDSATVSVGPGQLQVRPECLYVDAGEKVTLHLRLAEGIGEVKTMSKVGPLAEKEWLEKASRGEPIVFTAPATKAQSNSCEETFCEYRFQIVVDGVGRLDPRIRVRYAQN